MQKYKGPDPEKIQGIFSDVAITYDKANNFMTFGLAHSWRRKVVQLSKTPKDGAVLDCATGTGDLAIEFKKALPKATVIGSDFSQEMLNLAPKKAKDLNLDVDFQIGDVMNLNFEDNKFDTVTIAYGIRNVSDPKKGLEEMWRVIKPCGKLLVLETGDSDSPLSLPVKIYTKYMIPVIGGIVSKKKDAYKYLSNSSQSFPSKKDFLNLGSDLKDLKQSSFKSLMMGASYIYIFEKK